MRKEHSKWTYWQSFDYFSCDNCGLESDVQLTKCPKCGAIMDDAVEALKRIKKGKT